MNAAKPVLIGRFLSPYVRRVAVTLNLYGVVFEHRAISAVDDEAERERVNPVGRVPALVLPSGETLIDSAAIIDHLDEQAGADKALTPQAGEPRRQVMRRLALTTGAIDRAMAANAERRRPPEQTSPDRLNRLLRQAVQGFQALEDEFPDARFFGGEALDQSDLTAAVGFSFVNHIFPGTLPHKQFPRVAKMTGFCEKTPKFMAVRID